MPTVAATVELLHLFGDPTRMRLLALLAREELSVSELTSITQLPQSRVSTHLGKLREADVLRDRRAGASTFYALNDAAMPAEAKKVWGLLSAEVDDAVLESDRKRCVATVRARGQKWPEAVAGEMERHYSPGRTWEAALRGLVGLLDLGQVLDVGAGDGTIAELAADRARSWTCLDVREAMVDAARKRLAGRANVRYAVADAHALPFDDASFDQVLLFNVLTSAERPADVVAEAARVLRPRGTLAVIALDAHDHPEVTAAYGHLHAGFRPASLKKLLQRASLTVRSCEVTSRERRAPHFGVLTAFATRP